MKRPRYTAKDFAWSRWEEKDMHNAVHEALFELRENYRIIKTIPKADRTFENTVLAIERAGYALSDVMGKLGLLQNASPKETIRKTAGRISTALSTKLVEIEHDQLLYEAVKEYALKREKLQGPDKLLLDDMMQGYARMGFDLSSTKQKLLKKYWKKISKLSNAFDQNLNEYDDALWVTRTELDGLPETYIENLSKKNGTFRVSLAYPESGPFMLSAHDENLRRVLGEKLLRKGGSRNVRIMEKILDTRQRVARLLGYRNHVDYVTELRTAKSEKRVRAFLSDLMKKLFVAGQKELALLRTYKRKLTGDRKAQVSSHDVGYLFKQLLKEEFDLDTDLLKEYFPFVHVRKATLALYAELFGVVFKKRSMKLWHPDVEFFEIQDPKGNLLAYFALDLYPRKGKYGHAAVFDGITGRKVDGTYTTPFCTMMTNFPKPSKVNPSLMSHGEVETFFHEFGHLIHYTLTTCEHLSQAGFNTALDFVEAPSQMLENWVWDPAMLKRLSKHYKTGKPLPELLIQRLVATRFFGEAYASVRQIILSLFDLEVHTKNVRDLNACYAGLVRRYAKVPLPKTQRFVAGFGHLAHQYGGGYYSYMWSKVYAQDMFSRFEQKGILNKKVGAEYRKWILERGSSEEELELVKRFLGRRPNNKAFLRSLGIKTEK